MARKAAVAETATNYPCSPCTECAQDEEEQMNTKLNEADGQEADRGPEKAKKASGAVVSLIQGLSGKNRLAGAESFKPM